MFNAVRLVVIQYIVHAWLFSLLHLVLLIYFFLQRRRSRRELSQIEDCLEHEFPDSTLMVQAEEAVKSYAEQGREPDLRSIERNIVTGATLTLETLQPLVNGFVILGLMGTLFSLFRMGQELEQIKDARDVLQRMGVAFSASFFGLVWALLCSLFLLNPLRKKADQIAERVRWWLSDLSSHFPPRRVESTVEQIARDLAENVRATKAMFERLEVREEENLQVSRQILKDFQDTSEGLFSKLTTTIEDSQLRTEHTAEILKTNVVASLEELKERFLEISKTWRTELDQTITASGLAAEHLATSTENLTIATSDVAASLQSVR
jgi:methyl-accepting chemotaxis protein